MWDGEMSKSYEFQLDSFQAIAVACVVSNNNRQFYIKIVPHSIYSFS